MKDRVTCDPTMTEKGPKCCLDDLSHHYLLPTAPLQQMFKADCISLVGWVIAKYITAFQQFKDVVLNHIPHPHLEEISAKSESANLNLPFLN